LANSALRCEQLNARKGYRVTRSSQHIACWLCSITG